VSKNELEGFDVFAGGGIRAEDTQQEERLHGWLIRSVMWRRMMFEIVKAIVAAQEITAIARIVVMHHLEIPDPRWGVVSSVVVEEYFGKCWNLSSHCQNLSTNFSVGKNRVTANSFFGHLS